jgi:hypothetical protein
MIFRNLFLTDFWKSFSSELNSHKVVFLVKKDRLSLFKNYFVGNNILVEEYTKSNKGFFESFLMSLARSSLSTKTNLWSKMRSYYRGDSGFLSTYFKRVFTFIFGKSTLWKVLLRKLILTIRPDSNLLNLFNKYNPDILFATSMTNFDFDVPVSIEAKRRKVKIVGMVRSWDNLSSHGMLRVLPDVFLLQNFFLKEMLEKYQGMTIIDNVSIVGLPHYDIFKNLSKITQSRDDFCKNKGLDPKKKIILYGAMGDFLFMHENEMPEVLNNLIRDLNLENEVQILYRSHPKFKLNKNYKNLYKNIIFDINSSYIKNDKLADNDDGGDNDLINSLFHSSIVLTCGSTIAIDSAVADRPLVCTAFDGSTLYKDVSYWNSARRFYDSYTHFEELVKTGNIDIAYNVEELGRFIKGYLEFGDRNRDGRKSIIDRFVAPFDGRSGERLAGLLLEQIKKND